MVGAGRRAGTGQVPGVVRETHARRGRGLAAPVLPPEPRLPLLPGRSAGRRSRRPVFSPSLCAGAEPPALTPPVAPSSRAAGLWPCRGLERCPACGSYYAQRRRKKSHCVWSRGPARVDHEKYVRLKEQYFKRHSQEFEFGFTTDSPIDLIYYTTASNVNKAVTHFSTDFTVR